MDTPEQPLIEPTPSPEPARFGEREAGAKFAPTAVDPAPGQPVDASFPPWTVWDVLAVAGATFAAVFLCSILALGVAHLLTAGRNISVGALATNPVVVIGAQVVAYPLVILFMVTVVGARSREGFWRAIRWNWNAAKAPAFFLGGMLVAFVVDYGSKYLPLPKSVPLENYFHEALGAYVTTVFGITLGPLLEELFFRGLLYPRMRRLVGVVPAILFTAVVFASIHAPQLGFAWGPLLSIFVVGVVFTLVREKSGSVAATFTMHVGYNLLLFGMLWVTTDHFRHLEKVT